MSEKEVSVRWPCLPPRDAGRWAVRGSVVVRGPESWCEISPESIATFGVELARELAPGHALYGLPVRAIGLGNDGDDVLFVIEDGTERVAAVHLTWTQSPPDRPPFPSTTLYPSFSVWTAEEMRADGEFRTRR